MEPHRSFYARHRGELFRVVLLIAWTGAALAIGWMAGMKPDACPRKTHLLLEFGASGAYDCWRDATPALSEALTWDFGFILLYGSLLFYASRQAFRHAQTDAGRMVGRVGVIAGVLAAVLDVAENVSLLLMASKDGNSLVDLPVVFALPKWIFVGLALPGAIAGLRRLIGSLSAQEREIDLSPVQGGTAWSCNTRVPGVPGGAPDGIGIALSGGGIRSGSYSMGATQSLQGAELTGPGNRLNNVRFISSVSGGGYFAGARQMLINSDPETEPFLPGSYEENHVRVHGKYIADGPAEWSAAIARLLAGVLLNVGLVVGVLFAIGVPAGWIQSSLIFRDGPDVTGYMWGAVALTLGGAALCYIAAIISSPQSDAFGREVGARLYRVSAVLLVGGIIVLSLVFLLPAISSLSDSLTTKDRPASAIASGGGVLGFLATWLGLRGGVAGVRKAVPGLFGRLRSIFRKGATGGPSWASRLRLLRWLPGVILALTAVFVFARFVTHGRELVVRGDFRLFGLTGPLLLWWVCITAAILIVYTLSDQTSWSLHPFYKRRLASAFALERLATGDVGERFYADETTLEKLCDAPVGPELVLCCAANLSGKLAPPGRKALSFTFTKDWMGGPQIGYVSPGSVREILGKRAGDTTLLAGMAISGAAIASAMGRHSKGSLNAALAVFNVRLGVWLPSPHYLWRVAEGWAPVPGSKRRLGYALKEILGMYDSKAPYYYVTDGGHVENLGLVELLRRRCALIFCFDGSGGPLTLLEAVRLADEELGVQIEFPEGSYDAIREGSADIEDPDPVQARMAAQRVLVGTITYPTLDDEYPGGMGMLIYGRAALTEATDEVILEYASRNALFPNDPTGDQWFDVEQFNHYLALGREVANEALEEIELITGGPV